ncbi:MAG: methionyl-tRNA formyltransferase [Lachnospiraceae bacterium]|nr:methionyl-tRNA formyltransferase [Lachnospiraceae bacterium]
MRIVYMGTPDFAAAPLKTLIDCPDHQVLAVFTQPDKPKGRGKAMQFPPVKETALEAGLPVYQPRRIRDEQVLAILQELDPDVIVVAAYGQILPSSILHLPRYGCINLHASLLPHLRGAAPVQWSVILGDKESGVTTMQMNEGLDTGDMLEQIRVPLAADETGGSLFDKLTAASCQVMLTTLKGLEEGTIHPVPQQGPSTYAGLLTKETGRIHWDGPAEEIERLIRGLNPWPSAYSYLDGRMIKFWSARVVKTDAAVQSEGPVAGTIIRVSKRTFTILCGRDALEVMEVQAAGKKRMTADAWMRGAGQIEGKIFTETDGR